MYPHVLFYFFKQNSLIRCNKTLVIKTMNYEELQEYFDISITLDKTSPDKVNINEDAIINHNWEKKEVKFKS